MFRYAIDLTEDDNGTYLVTSPDLPEVTTFGENRQAAFEHAVDAIEEAIGARMARWEDVPTGSGGAVSVRLPLQASMKLALLLACKEAGVSRAELVRRLGVHREQVDRLFKIDHASKVDQIESAFEAIGKTLDIEVREDA